MAGYENLLKSTSIDADVFGLIVQHAFSSGKVEIVGLLIGEIDDLNKKTHIKSLKICRRSDRKPDRVEISPEQLAEGAIYADKLSERLQKVWRVIGWYHSHPHVAVWPSGVDLRTQAMHQQMHSLFVGLTFSVFITNKDNTNVNTVHMCCFQSIPNGHSYEQRCVPLEIVPSSLKPYNLEGSILLPKVLYEEEMIIHSEEASAETDQLTLLYNDAMKAVEVVHIMSLVSKPLVVDLEERLNITRRRIAHLEKLKKRLMAQNNK